MKWIIHDRYNLITILSIGNSHFAIDIVTKSTTSSPISIMNSMHLIANVKLMFTLFTTYLLRSSAKYQKKPSDVSCELNERKYYDKQKTVDISWCFQMFQNSFNSHGNPTWLLWTMDTSVTNGLELQIIWVCSFYAMGLYGCVSM